MLEDDERGEVCLEPLDDVKWWRVTERTRGRGLNLRLRPDKTSPPQGVALRFMVLRAVAPPVVPAPAGSKYGECTAHRTSQQLDSTLGAAVG
jgi:hypothetical protein